MYSGPSPLRHLCLRDTAIQVSQNLVSEKCSHNLCTSTEGKRLFGGKGHFSWVPKPGFKLHSGDTLALIK